MIDPAPWANRPHPGPATKPLALTDEQRQAIEAELRPGKAQKRVVLRGQPSC
jgi:hypothetical protein